MKFFIKLNLFNVNNYSILHLCPSNSRDVKILSYKKLRRINGSWSFKGLYLI